MNKLSSIDRTALIRLAASLPKGDESRRAILAGLEKLSAWQNYNTIGPRRFLTNLMEILENSLPATWSVTKDAAEIASLQKKWGSKGRNVKMRGISGKVILHRGATMFIGTVGGTPMAVKTSRFKASDEEE